MPRISNTNFCAATVFAALKRPFNLHQPFHQQNDGHLHVQQTAGAISIAILQRYCIHSAERAGHGYNTSV